MVFSLEAQRRRELEELESISGVPVWNGMSDIWHPTQMLADLATIAEHSSKPLADVSIAYVGDARSNVANSLLVGSATLGLDVRLVAPALLEARRDIVTFSLKIARESGASIVETDDVIRGLDGVDFIYADTWVWIGESMSAWRARVELLSDYRITTDLLARSNNPQVKFLHCLPAIHDESTPIGRSFRDDFGREPGEVADDVFDSPASIVFDQAENRLHTIKALMVSTLSG